MSRVKPFMKTIVTIVVSIATITILGWLDYVTGPDLSFSLFYIIPISAFGWWLGQTPACFVASAASVICFAADMAWHGLGYLPISAWNASTRLFIFLFIAMSLARLRKDREALLALNQRQTALFLEAERLSLTDFLTGLSNFRAFTERLTAEILHLRGRGASLCLMYIDLDNFKQVNDQYGHSAGDDVLKCTAEVLRRCVRANDLLARLGGDEFAVAAWGINPEAAKSIALRLIQELSKVGDAYQGAQLGASVGVVYLPNPPEDVDSIVRLADAAMYAAKGAGKGQIVFSI